MLFDLMDIHVNGGVLFISKIKRYKCNYCDKLVCVTLGRSTSVFPYILKKILSYVRL
jgi:hypothetical protein